MLEKSPDYPLDRLDRLALEIYSAVDTEDLERVLDGVKDQAFDGDLAEKSDSVDPASQTQAYKVVINGLKQRLSSAEQSKLVYHMVNGRPATQPDYIPDRALFSAIIAEFPESVYDAAISTENDRYIQHLEEQFSKQLETGSGEPEQMAIDGEEKGRSDSEFYESATRIKDAMDADEKEAYRIMQEKESAKFFNEFKKMQDLIDQGDPVGASDFLHELLGDSRRVEAGHTLKPLVEKAVAQAVLRCGSVEEAARVMERCRIGFTEGSIWEIWDAEVLAIAIGILDMWHDLARPLAYIEQQASVNSARRLQMCEILRERQAGKSR